MRKVDQPKISSKLLGISAYQQAQGKRPRANTPGRPLMVVQPKKRFHPVQSEQSSKELKMTVLKSLHTQSNAGLVRMRDVASALDKLLKSPG